MRKNGTSNKFISPKFPHLWTIRGKFSKFIVVQCLYSSLVITNVCNEKKIGNFITPAGYLYNFWGTYLLSILVSCIFIENMIL